jgi:curli biogenesis system outer membrane secretion channel CsgG
LNLPQLDRDLPASIIHDNEDIMKITTPLVALILMGLLALGPAGVASAGSKEPTTEEIQAELERLACHGPKTRVAIYSFYATGKLAAFEGYNVGDGLAAQLATELMRTDCFIVLDRTGLSPVLREQELSLAGVVNRETGPDAGRMIGAEVIIKGTVTEYEPNKRGGGLTVGAALPSVPFGLRLGRNGSKAHVGLDISVVDASTGHVTSAHRVTADSRSGGWTLGLDHERASIGGDRFAKSPLGVAARNALGKAVLTLAEELGHLPWRSQVVDASDNTIFLNAGQAAGIQEGDVYRVSTVVRTLVDPSTGLLLDTIEREVGQVRVLTVKEKYAMAEPLEGIQVKRGDYVHL